MQSISTRYEVENFIDPQPILEALERRDDSAIWKAEKAAPSPSQFFQSLREQIGNITTESMSTRSGMRVRHHYSLLMTPVVMPAGMLERIQSNEAKAARSIGKLLVSWLTQWMEQRYTLSAFYVPLGYSEICCGGPSAMRSRLEHLITKEQPKGTYSTDFAFQLPPNAPSLSFILAAVHSPMTWPELPPEDDHADMQLVGKLAGGLQYAAADDHPLKVLVPDFIVNSLRDGLIAWIQQIHHELGIVTWDATPVSTDEVWLHLQVGDSPHISNIPLRAHMLGLDGIKAVLDTVANLNIGLQHHGKVADLNDCPLKWTIQRTATSETR